MPGEDKPQRSLAQRVAEATLSRYRASIARPGGPRVQNGVAEWNILASVCLVLPRADTLLQDSAVEPIALGTGTKALPFERLQSAHGDLLHDCHAEVTARRSARRWLIERMVAEKAAHEAGLEECDGLPFLFRETEGSNATSRFRLRTDVQVWWYISTLPCESQPSASSVAEGQAISCFLHSASSLAQSGGECSTPAMTRRQQEQDRLAGSCTPTHTTEQQEGEERDGTVLRGRLYLNNSAPMLRTVPGRIDSPPSLSHSCTDKLLVWSLLGWQGSALSRWLEPIGIHSIVVANDAGSASSIESEVQRGLDIRRRLRRDQGKFLEQLGGRDLSPPDVFVVPQHFEESQEKISESVRGQADSIVPSWTSHSWIRPSQQGLKVLSSIALGSGHRTPPSSSKETETIVNGVKQGASLRRAKTADGRLCPLPEKSRSRACKLETHRILAKLSSILSQGGGPTDIYSDVKGKGRVVGEGTEAYRKRKAALRGSTPVDAQERRVAGWLNACKQQTRAQVEGQTCQIPSETDPEFDPPIASGEPLSGWLVTPSRFESFDIDGMFHNSNST